jgi:hypothetical protein
MQVNEDGSEILLNGESLSIKEYQPKHTRIPVRMVDIGRKKVSVPRLVLECWQGMPENLDCAARRHDESKGDHYTNLYWGRKGMTKSSVIGHAGVAKSRKLNEAQVNEIDKRRESGETLKEIMKDYEASEMAYHRAKKRYGQKD